MQNKRLNSFINRETRLFLLKRLESPNKDLVKERVFKKLYTNHPQPVFKHNLSFLFSFGFKKYAIGALLVLITLVSAVVADGSFRLEPGKDNVPYLTRIKVVENAKYAFLNVLSHQKAGEYNEALIARRVDELSSLTKKDSTEPSSIESVILVSKDLANRFGYSQNLVAPNETRLALQTVKKVNEVARGALENLVENQKEDSKTQEARSLIDSLIKTTSSTLKEQVALKLEQTDLVNINAQTVIDAKRAYENGDFLAALERLEAHDKEQLVKGDASSDQNKDLNTDAGLVALRPEQGFAKPLIQGTSQEVKLQPVREAKQIEYQVGLEF